MKRWKNITKCAISLGTAVAMLAAPCIKPVSALTAKAAAGSAGQHYSGEMNSMTSEDYAKFGLTNNSPAEFDPNDTSHPMEGYESYEVSELYIGYMNKSSKWTGEFKVMDNVSGASERSLNIDNMEKTTVGKPYDFSNMYAKNKDLQEVQTNNSCAIDCDGDGIDEILNITLYVQKKCAEDPKNRSRIDIRLMDRDETSDEWMIKSTLGYDLVDKDSNKKEFVWDIEADSSKAYAVLTAGDFDGDGKEEAAVYIPSKKGKQPDPYILILKADSEGTLKEKATIPVSNLNSGKNVFNCSYDGNNVPVVSLATTKISGRDDLVVNVSHPQKKQGDSGQLPAMGIYRYEEKNAGSVSMNRMYQKTMKYSSFRMRFSSAVDTDLDGDGIDELLIGGYKNVDYKADTDVGKLDKNHNLIQLICWNGRTYEEVWNEPKTVEGRSDLHLGLEMLEPAALAAGALHTNSKRESVFLEGLLLSYGGENQKAPNQKERLKNGAFTTVCKTALGGSHSAFISTAHAARYTTASGSAEQIVVLSGDHYSMDNDSIYYDIGWIWEDIEGHPVSKITNDNFINKKEEDDDGTFISLCPLNVDADELKLKYKGKNYGWSDPILYAVLLSPPYWSELQYNSESFGIGASSYEISYGNSTEHEKEEGLGLALCGGISVLAGAGLFGTGAMGGFSIELEAMGKHVSGYSTENTIEESYKLSVRAGEDKAILTAVPMVCYTYDMWVPDFTVDQDYIDAYKQLSEDHTCPYQVGEIVKGHWEPYTVTTKQRPSFSNISLERYNELVREYRSKGHENLVEITDDMIPQKTIGDPSTYPHSVDELTNPDNISNLFVSGSSAAIKVGDDEVELGYAVEKGKGQKSVYELGIEGAFSLIVKGEVSLFATTEIEAEGGFKVDYEGSWANVTTSTEGSTFSSVIKDLPAGSNEKYLYHTQMAVYNAKNIPRGDGDDTGAFVVSYITDLDPADAPPKIPDSFRVFGTTENEAILKWDSADYRSAKSYEIFLKDNTGRPVSVCKTNDTYYIATDLDPAAYYSYAIKAYSGENQTGTASSMSRWITVETKGNSASDPHFTESPKNIVASANDSAVHTLTAKAEKGQGMENASLSYQWEKYSEDELTKEGVWESINGATGETYTLPSVTQETPAQSHYRVIATQRSGSRVISIVSRVATLFLNQQNGNQTFYETELSIQPQESSTLHMANEDHAYVKNGTANMQCAYTVQANSANVPAAECIFLARQDGKDQRIGATFSSDGTATLDLSKLAVGDYELYGVYPGGYGSAQDHSRYYLPAQSAVKTLHIVDVYNINYQMNEGINDPENPTVLTDESKAVELKEPVLEGYAFAGWYLDAQFEQPLPDNTLDPQTLTTDVNLYAKWTPIEYPISYDLDEGENHEENPETYTMDDGVVELQDPVREGYQFDGWYLDADYTQQLNAISEALASEDLTCYAKWKEKLPQELIAKFESLKKSVGASSVKQTVEGAANAVTYTSSDPEVATVNKNGKISFKSVGTATITAQAAENVQYKSSSHVCNVTVVPQTAKIQSLASDKSGQVQIKSTKATSGNTGYEIQYRKTGSDKVNTVTVKNTEALDKTLKNLKPGTKIKFRIRAYKAVKGKTYYGKYSDYKSVTVA